MEKCSLLISPCFSARATMDWRERCATSCARRRSRFREKLLVSKGSSTIDRSRNQRNRKSLRSRSRNIRSLRTLERAIRGIALRSRSGGVDGRLVRAYLLSKTGDSLRRHPSAKRFTPRAGWSFGKSESGDMSTSIEPCPSLVPRTATTDSHLGAPVGRLDAFFSNLLRARRPSRPP